METTQYIVIVLALFGILSSCNFSNEEDCGGDGGIQVNHELYSEVTVAVGDTLFIDLLGDPPVFSHPNDVPITLWGINGKDPDIAEVKFIFIEDEYEILMILGKSPGHLSLSIEAVDDCAGEKNIAVKNVELMVME